MTTKIVDFILKLKVGKVIRNLRIDNKTIETFDLNQDFETGTWSLNAHGKLKSTLLIRK